MGILSTVLAFVANVASDLAASEAARLLQRIRFPIPASLFGHRRELAEKLREMPFIYRNTGAADVLRDYVQVEVGTIDLNTLDLKQTSSFDIGTLQRLRARRKVLVLGNAGIGKTTFLRHTILTLIRKPSDLTFLPPDIRFVPFYVPLKAVDNAQPFPILRHLLENNKYLRGRRGMRRLRRLASAGRLFLFLDGYDEIYLDLGTHSNGRNYVRDELDTLLGNRELSPAYVRPPAGYNAFYDDFRYCRAWLATRKEFFLQNPIDLSRVADVRIATVDFLALGIFGIGNQRMALVRRIFDKYRSRSETYLDLLNEELFLSSIDRYAPAKIGELSYSPLFLTVMCYIYCQRVSDANSAEVDWASTASELVLSCVDLLLKDLDEFKVRGLPEARRTAVIQRRDEHVEEKTAFLGFFACELLIDGLTVFERDYLDRKAKQFFRNSESTNAPSIIKRLDDKRGRDSITTQLLNQGVFVMVVKRDGNILFDFPHRRFREELAARYMDDNSHVERLLANLHRADLSEFAYVFFRLSPRRSVLTEHMLTHALSGDKRTRDHYGLLLSNCLRHSPDEYDVTAVLERLFLDSILKREPFRIDIAVFDRFTPSLRFTEQLANVAQSTLAEGHIFHAQLIAFILARYRPDLMNTVVTELLRQTTDVRVTIRYFASFVLLNDASVLISELAYLRRSMDIYAEVVAAIGRHDFADDAPVIRAMISALEDREDIESVTFWSTLFHVNSERFSRIARLSFVPTSQFRIASIIRATWEETYRIEPISLSGQDGFVVAPIAAAALDAAQVESFEVQGLEVGRVCNDPDEILPRLRDRGLRNRILRESRVASSTVQRIVTGTVGTPCVIPVEIGFTGQGRPLSATRV